MYTTHGVARISTAHGRDNCLQWLCPPPCLSVQPHIRYVSVRYWPRLPSITRYNNICSMIHRGLGHPLSRDHVQVSLPQRIQGAILNYGRYTKPTPYNVLHSKVKATHSKTTLSPAIPYAKTPPIRTAAHTLLAAPHHRDRKTSAYVT